MGGLSTRSLPDFMKTPVRLVSIGEVLWDLLPDGPQLGGAPANLACHARALGAQAALISRVGVDAHGEEALRQLEAHGVDVTLVTQDLQAPTGTVRVEVDSAGNPRFEIVENVAWDALEATDCAWERVAQADVVCFGSLAQRTRQGREAVQRLIQASSSRALKVFDVNLRAPFFNTEVLAESLRAADLLKLNEMELPVLASLFGLNGTVERRVEQLADLFELQVVVLTLGAAGSRLWRKGQWHSEPGRVVTVRDAVGAGDSFTAALVLGLLRNWSSDRILAAATEIAAYVCTQSGATPRLPESLTASFLGE